MPLLFVVMAFGAGVWVADLWGYQPPIYWLISALCTCVLATFSVVTRSVARWPGRLGTIAILFTVFLLGGWRTNATYLPKQATFFTNQLAEGDLLAGVIGPIRPGQKTLRTQVELTYLLNDSLGNRPVTGQLLLYLPPSEKAGRLQAGDKVVFQGDPTRLRPPLNPYVFDLRNYWSRQGVYHQLFLRDDTSWRATGAGATGLRATAERWRTAWFKSFQDHLSGDRLAVAAALVMGKRDLISPEVKSAYADTGAIHVLAVSGLHVGIIFLIIRTIFGRILRLNRTKHGRVALACISTLSVWIFAFVSGLSPSVQRAAIMFTVLAFGGLLKRKSYIFNTLSFAALLMLWGAPNQFFQLGFQLSFTAIIGIVLFTPPLNRMVFWPNSVLRSIWSTLAASTGAQLGTLPLSLYHFGRFPLYFLLSGTVVIISAFAAMLAGLLHGLVAGLFPGSPLANASGGFLGIIISVQNAIIFFFQRLPYALLQVQHFDAWAALLLALAIGGLAIWLRWRKRWAIILFACALLACLLWARTQVPSKDRAASLIVYHLSRTSLIDVTEGQEAFAFGQEPTPDNLPWSAGPRRETLGYRPAVTLPLTSTGDTVINDRIKLEFPLLSIGTTHWFLLDGAVDKLDYSSLKKATHLLVRNKYPIRDFPDFNPDHQPVLIVDGSNPYYLLEQWRQLAAERGLEIWVTAEGGAYELKY